MHQHPTSRSIVGLVLSLGLAATAAAAGSQAGYPEAQDPYVTDLAAVISPSEATEIRSLFSRLESETGIEATVLTIGSIRDYSTGDPSIESFSTSLFNAWGIGDRERNDGVLILVAVGDRKVRIELGAGYGGAAEPRMQRVIDAVMVPRFRQGDFGGGIARGAAAVAKLLSGGPPEAPVPRAGVSGTRPVAPEALQGREPSRRRAQRPAPRSYGGPVRRRSFWSSPVRTIAALLLLGVSAVAVPIYLRRRARRCPNCAAAMRRLDETSDDAYLDAGQQAEEALGSVNYDVWKCPSCNWHTLKPYRRWFSSTKVCPDCAYRTLRVRSHTVRRPTYFSTGTKQIDMSCSHCDFSDTDTVILPRLTRQESHGGSFTGSHSGSSAGGSTGGGSFGGGRSSGGGASGSW